MLKFILLAVVVLAAVWLLRSARKRVSDEAPPKSAPSAPPLQHEDMVACAQCGMHLPASEALPGRGGVFCGEAHRLSYENTHAER